MIDTRIENEDDIKIKYTFVKGPRCGQIIGEVKHASGICLLRIMCRRCHKYISVNIT